MASEIRVNKINSSTGVGTITLSPTGVDISGITTVSTLKVGTGLTASEDGDIFFTGVCTATTFAGSGANLTALPAAQVTGTLPAISGANLTNLPAANLTGALPAISGANLTGIAATDNVRTGILDVAGIATFRSDVNLPNINGSQIGGRRNLIINGAMNIAQRGTSSTTSGYGSVDRIQHLYSGTDEAPTFSQADVASGTTPYSLGFRKSIKVTNGNQTSGAGAADRAEISYKAEAQDLAKSGWNYTSTSSYITLSFWIKSSVAQSFYLRLLTADGTSQRYAFETGSLSADTWTKITKTIPGNSNLQFDNNVSEGLKISWYAFLGTDYTDSSSSDTWAAGTSGNRTPDQTSTWWTTNDSTLELTGVQLEVGSQATPFEHEDNNTTLRRCQRYFWKMGLVSGAWIYVGVMGNSSSARFRATFPVPMRANPTITFSDLYIDSEISGSVETVNSVATTHFNSDFGGRIEFNTSSSTASSGAAVSLYPQSSSGYLQGEAEL